VEQAAKDYDAIIQFNTQLGQGTLDAFVQALPPNTDDDKNLKQFLLQSAQNKWKNQLSKSFQGQVSVSGQIMGYLFETKKTDNRTDNIVYLTQKQGPFTLMKGALALNDAYTMTQFTTLTTKPFTNVSGLGYFEKLETETSNLLTTPLAKANTLASFLLFQFFVALGYLASLAFAYKSKSSPKFSPILAVVGFVCFLLIWTVGYERFSLYDLDGLFGFWLNDGNNSTVFPKINLVICLLGWCLNIVYSLFAVLDQQDERGDYKPIEHTE
jgi:hypothetical protein